MDVPYSHSTIALVVLSEGLLLAIGVVVTVVFLYLRSLWRLHESAKQREYSDILVDFVFKELGSQEVPKAELPAIWFWQERTYRDEIIHQIRVLSGEERALLVRLYVRSGFLKQDEHELRSRDWSRRLRALIRMDLVSMPESRPAFERCLRDRNALVALSATRALSRLDSPVDPDILFASLERVGGQRREAVIEIISNIGQRLGATAVARYLEAHSDSKLAGSCIRVLGDLRALDAMPVFTEILSTPENLSSKILAELLDAIRKIGDPMTVSLVRPLLHHSSPEVRARSLLFLDEVGEVLTPEEFELLRTDTSIDVRRVLERPHTEKAA